MASSRSRPATSSTRTASSGTRPAKPTPARRATSAPGSMCSRTRPSNTSWTRVGGNELESTTIGRLRFDKTGSRVWAATLRGVWWHSTASYTGPWTLAFAANPGNLPTALQAYTVPGSQIAQATFGTNTSSTTQAPYKNIVNDVAVDPNNANHVIAAVGWRSGDTYNGFYETTDGGLHWAKINPTGALPRERRRLRHVRVRGRRFEALRDQRVADAAQQGDRKCQQLPRRRLRLEQRLPLRARGRRSRTRQKLANSGSALKQSVGGKGYGPGIQAWYNQSLTVDPDEPEPRLRRARRGVRVHRTAARTGTTIAPVLELLLPLLAARHPLPAERQRARARRRRTPTSTRLPSAAPVRAVPLRRQRRRRLSAPAERPRQCEWQRDRLDRPERRHDGRAAVLRGRHRQDQGPPHHCGRRPGRRDDDDRHADRERAARRGRAERRARQRRPAGQRRFTPAARVRDTMVSNFGGDGGDVLVDPNDGCNIVQEYVDLAMSVTQTCAHPNLLNPSTRTHSSTRRRRRRSTSRRPTSIARFIAPFVANEQNIDEWLAGGNSLWIQDKGFAIREPSEWTKAYTLATPNLLYTALAMSGNEAIGGWCGATLQQHRLHAGRDDRDEDGRASGRSPNRRRTACRTGTSGESRSVPMGPTTLL